jgi:hypothetical protein
MGVFYSYSTNLFLNGWVAARLATALVAARAVECRFESGSPSKCEPVPMTVDAPREKVHLRPIAESALARNLRPSRRRAQGSFHQSPLFVCPFPTAGHRNPQRRPEQLQFRESQPPICL